MCFKHIQLNWWWGSLQSKHPGLPTPLMMSSRWQLSTIPGKHLPFLLFWEMGNIDHTEPMLIGFRYWCWLYLWDGNERKIDYISSVSSVVMSVIMSRNYDLVVHHGTILLHAHYGDVTKAHGDSDHRLLKCLFNSLLGASIKGTSKIRITGPLWRESTGDRWIPLTKGQLCGKRFDVMTSSWVRSLFALLWFINRRLYIIQGFPMPVMEPWRIWVQGSNESVGNWPQNHSKTKHNNIVFICYGI